MLQHTQNSLRKIPGDPVRTLNFTAGVTNSIPSQGTKIPACCAIWQKKNLKKRKKKKKVVSESYVNGYILGPGCQGGVCEN